MPEGHTIHRQVVDLTTPRTCAVIDALTQGRLIARLGPDPIAADDGGRIITVDRREAAATDRRRTYVYGQRRCARCGSVIRRWDLGGRTAWACETCQPAGTGPCLPGRPSSAPEVSE